MLKYLLCSLLLVLLLACSTPRSVDSVAGEDSVFAMNQLIPWSIVAFDVKERSPEQRIAMIDSLGYTHFAYGGRPQHTVRMREEWKMAADRGIAISSVWMYINHEKDQIGKLKAHSEETFAAIKEVGLKTQIWVGFHHDYFKDIEADEALRRAVAMIGYLAGRADSLGCKVALYNHGGWFGEPENQLAIIKALPQYEIGVVYNFHHGHDHLDRFPAVAAALLPHLWCVSLNGMRAGGPKIMTIGEGDREEDMIRTLLNLGYRAPWAILGHVKGGDPAVILERNIHGLRGLGL